MAVSSTSGNLPLEGLRVLELGHIVAGPTASLILADLGADVIKIENPDGGDQARRMPGAGSGYYFFNRNKRSVAIDLKSALGKDAVPRRWPGRPTCASTITRPARSTDSGSASTCSPRKIPRLIYMAIKGFLPGPYEHRPSLDELAQMMGGLAFMTGPPGRPLRAGASIIDIGAATYGVIGILAALYQRAETRARPDDHLRPVRNDGVLGRPMDGARGGDRPALAPHGGGRAVGADGVGHFPFIRDRR